MTGQTEPVRIALNKPRIGTGLSVEKALAKRRSSRTFSERTVQLDEVGQLLLAAQGIAGHFDIRTAPSAGALHQMMLTVVAAGVDGLPAGLYRYHAESHDLALLSDSDHREQLRSAANQQEAIGLSTTSMAAFDDEQMAAAAHLDAGHHALYVMPVGCA